MKNDLLVDISTFLARAWSGKGVIVNVKKADPQLSVEQGTVTLPTLDYYSGDDFDRYRQWRVQCWLSAMRMKYSKKYLSNDHAYGFVLNVLEQQRVERLGITEWPGMLAELVFNEAMSWQYQRVVNSLYGLERKVIAFAQYFLTGYIKGDLDSFESGRVERATRIARDVIDEAVSNNYTTEWVEQFVPKILSELDANPLLVIPFPYTRSRIGVRISNQELISIVERIMKLKKIEEDGDNKLVKDVLEGRGIREEFESLKRLSKMTEKQERVSVEKFPLEIPASPDAAGIQYEPDLVNKLKSSLKNWKKGWVERHSQAGDEFDVEGYLHARDTSFIKDVDLKIRSKLVILLDHSSSIASGEKKYKRVFVALCRVLDYLGVKFTALAFNTAKGSTRCWIVKSPEEGWSRVSERRLQNVNASGGTPLAEVYRNTMPLVKSFKPEIFLTLSDGEPNDPSAAREAVSTLKRMSIHMVSFGIGEDTDRALQIAQNLKKLGYDRCVAISRLDEIPKKVLKLLASAQ